MRALVLAAVLVSGTATAIADADHDVVRSRTQIGAGGLMGGWFGPTRAGGGLRLVVSHGNTRYRLAAEYNVAGIGTGDSHGYLHRAGVTARVLSKIASERGAWFGWYLEAGAGRGVIDWGDTMTRRDDLWLGAGVRFTGRIDGGHILGQAYGVALLFAPRVTPPSATRCTASCPEHGTRDLGLFFTFEHSI